MVFYVSVGGFLLYFGVAFCHVVDTIFFMCGLCCLGRCAFVVLLSPVFVWLGLYVTPNLWTVLSVFFVLLA